MKNLTQIACGLFAAALAQTATADTLALFEYNSTFVPTSVAANLSTTSNSLAIFGSGVTGAKGLSASGNSGYLGGSNQGGLYTRSAGIGDGSDTGDYVAWNLTAAEGFEMNLTSFSFYYMYNTGINPPATTTATFSLRSSVDGFTTDLFSGTMQAKYNGGQPAFSLGTASLGALAAYQQLSTVEFRVYLSDSGLEDNNYNLRLDQVSFEGTVASVVPEPSTFALFAGMVCVGAAAFRRRRA